MKLLISPQEVVAMAFAGSPGVSAERIGEAVIFSAQQKFVRPVVGNGLYKRLTEGQAGGLLNEHIKPALAQYVRLLMLPRLAVSVGDVGITHTRGVNMEEAGRRSVMALCKATRSDACALMRAAVEHIEANAADYPEYDPQENILGRLSICSQIIL